MYKHAKWDELAVARKWFLLAQMLIILGGGAVWFVVLVPGAFFWNRREPEHIPS